MKTKIILVICIILCLETVFLSVSNYKLRKEVERLSILIYEDTSKGKDIAKEASIPEMVLIDIADGKEISLLSSIRAKEGLLFIFSTTCITCDQISGAWNDLYDMYRGKYTIFGISIDPATETNYYLSRNDIRFPVYLVKDPVARMRFTQTPSTIYIDRLGHVIKSIIGNLDDIKKEQEE